MTPFQLFLQRQQCRRAANQRKRRVVFNQFHGFDLQDHSKVETKQNEYLERSFIKPTNPKYDKQLKLALEDLVVAQKCDVAERPQTLSNPPSTSFANSNNRPSLFSAERQMNRSGRRLNTMQEKRSTKCSPIHTHRAQTRFTSNESRMRAHTERKATELLHNQAYYKIITPILSRRLPRNPNDLSIEGIKFNLQDIHYDRQYNKLLSTYNAKYHANFGRKPSAKAKPRKLIDFTKKSSEIAPWQQYQQNEFT